VLELRATTKTERDMFFEALREELIRLGQDSLTSLGLSWSGLVEAFETTGEIRAVVADGEVAGFKGRGIGPAIFQSLEDEFRRSATQIGIGALRSNVEAIGFYEHLGFVPSDVEAPPGFVNHQRLIPSD